MKRRFLFQATGASLAGALVSSCAMNKVADAVTGGEMATGLPTLSEKTPLLLNFNENSIGMAPSAKRAVAESLNLSFRYPDSQRAALITALAEKYGVSETSVSLGNGSSENIQAIVQALIQRARNRRQKVQLVTVDPTFNYAELYAKAQKVPVVKVPLSKTMRFDIAAMKKAAATFPGMTIFYLCNPNNPTAMITEGAILQKWIQGAPKNQFFLLDEAYAEFVTDPDFVSGIAWVKQGYQNVAVTRTFSKLYALAGLRIGYAIASANLIEEFDSFMSIDNTNLTAAVAALASLQDKHFAQMSVASVSKSRQIVVNALDELKLKYAPSHANFIYHEIKGDVATYQKRMKAQHVMVGREFPPIIGWNRLTLGTPQEMMVFVKVLKSFREKGWV